VHGALANRAFELAHRVVSGGIQEGAERQIIVPGHQDVFARLSPARLALSWRLRRLNRSRTTSPRARAERAALQVARESVVTETLVSPSPLRPSTESGPAPGGFGHRDQIAALPIAMALLLSG